MTPYENSCGLEKTAVSKTNMSMQHSAPIAINADLTHLFQTIKTAVQQTSPQVRFLDVGTVQHIGSGVATLSGLPHAQIDEIVTFSTGVQGLVLNLGQRHVDVILLGSDSGIQGGDLVVGSGKRLAVPVGLPLLGRVVNALGIPLDNGGSIEGTATRMLEQEPPSIVTRSALDQPIYTGLKIVDALIPIGRGQRELIIGDRQTGKTTLAIDTILNQAQSGVRCIYVAVGQKKSTTLAVIDMLKRSGAMTYSTVVVAGADDPPALRFLAPYAGCSMAEALRDIGHDVLIVYDDLTKQADAYRELSLLLRRPTGREAYPGDVFYLHSRLLERAGKWQSGASVTALPIVQMQKGNISGYIPTNLISITDGQLVLDSGLFHQGVKPAINIGLSVSRVGGAVQSATMRAVSDRLRLELAQFEEVAHFARFGAEVDDATQQQIQRGKGLRSVLIQPPHEPLSLAEQVLILLTAVEGYLDQMLPQEILSFEEALLAEFQTAHPKLLSQLLESDTLEPPLRQELLTHIDGFCNDWHKRRQSHAKDDHGHHSA